MASLAGSSVCWPLAAATSTAGLSTAVGEVAAALAAVARAGELPARTCGRVVGTALACARLIPPGATAAAAALSGDEAAALEFELAAEPPDDCRAMAVVLGPGAAVAEACGPAFVGTSAARVTTLATAAVVLRLGDGVVGPDGPVMGSCAAAPVARRGVSVAAGATLAASCAAAGSPELGACWGAAVDCRRVEVLAAATSADGVVCVRPVGAGWAAVAAAMLGAPLWRLSVGVSARVGAGLGVRVVSVRAIRA